MGEVELRTETGRLLKKFLDGIMDSDELCDRAERVEPGLIDQSVNAALHAAQHFEDDADSFLKDPEYERMQRRQLEEFAQLLLEGKALPGCDIEFYKPRFFKLSFFSFFHRRKKKK